MTTLYEEMTSPFNYDLHDLGKSYKKKYRKADPFPHGSIDNLISEDLLDKVLEEFPSPSGIKWNVREREGVSHKKLISRDVEKQFGPYTKYLVNRLNSPTFLAFLEELTGIEGLIPDPYLDAGGLHQIGSGGFLEMHTDFHWNQKLRLFRRINLLLYLNKDWKEEYNGHLEFWNRDMEKKVAILPSWNRIAMFSIGPYTYHGFPEPIQCPEDMTRKSLAFWYYTSQLDKETIQEFIRNKPAFIKRDETGKPKLANA
ncbi:MAG: 2OG-Fe(II) oxygenase [bacterium]